MQRAYVLLAGFVDKRHSTTKSWEIAKMSVRTFTSS